MKLIYSTASPYARTARIFVHELGLGEQVEEVFQHPFENPAELIEANPLCKVPCLIDDEGKAIFDSQVICEYLDALAGPRLFKEIHKDWHLKTLYSLTRGLLDSAVAWQQDKMREPGQRSEFWQERFIKSIDRGLEYFEQRLDELPKEQYLILYCETGGRAQSVIKKLEEQGYTKMMNWGGFKRWPYEPAEE